MEAIYRADVWGSTGYAVYRVDDAGLDRPLVPLRDQEAARDLATAMNWAAEDRERHEGEVT